MELVNYGTNLLVNGSAVERVHTTTVIKIPHCIPRFVETELLTRATRCSQNTGGSRSGDCRGKAVPPTTGCAAAGQRTALISTTGVLTIQLLCLSLFVY